MAYEIDTTEKVLAAMDSMKAEIAEWRTRCEAAEREAGSFRFAMTGACATLDDAAKMGSPNAAKMRDLFRALLTRETTDAK